MNNRDAMPLGVRGIAFVVRHLVTLGVSVVVFGAVGVAASFLIPRPYVDRAIVEVGLRFMNEPLEHPMVAASRLTGYLQKAAAETGAPEAELHIEIRRAQKTNAVTRLIDIRVEADSADTARAIIDRSVDILVKEHSRAHDVELASLASQIERLETAAARLQQQIGETEDPTDELTAALATTNRMIGSTRSVGTDVRLPKTRVVSHAVEPQRTSSRLPILVVGGLVFGLLFGISLAAWRETARQLA